MFLLLLIFVQIYGFGYRDQQNIRAQVEYCMVSVKVCQGRQLISDTYIQPFLAKCFGDRRTHDMYSEKYFKESRASRKLHHRVHNLNGMLYLQFCLKCFSQGSTYLVILQNNAFSPLL